jgi:hypothetical protein
MTLKLEGGWQHEDGEEVEVGGKKYLVIGLSSGENGFKTVSLAGDDGDIELQFDRLGFSLDDETAIATGVRKARKAEFARLGVVFTEGDHGCNLIGNYTILLIDEDLKQMEVEYTDGHQKGARQKLETLGQASHIRHEKVRQMGQSKARLVEMAGPDESFTIGYLAANGVLDCTVRHDQLGEFLDTYKNLAGESAESYVGSYIFTRNVDNGGPTFRIIFSMPVLDALNAMKFKGEEHDTPITIPAQHSYGHGEAMTFNGRNFFFNLVRMGFRFGKKQDIAKIRSNVGDQEMFDKGVRCGLETDVVAA